MRVADLLSKERVPALFLLSPQFTASLVARFRGCGLSNAILRYVPCKAELIPCSTAKNSLFVSQENDTRSLKLHGNFELRLFAFTMFPANFPVRREFALETGSRLTGSSATQSGLGAEFFELAGIAEVSAA